MAFTNVTLNTQQLLESTFISDMRLILNSNNSVVKNKLEDLFNTLEIDLTNKYIGVDNYINQVKTNNVILGNSITFMDSTNTIASLTKAAGESTFTVDNLVISAGGTIDMTGAANTVAITRLGIGLDLVDVTADGLYVGNSSTSVKSEFYGETKFPSQAITQSTEGSTNTTITTTLTGSSYYGELKLSKSSKQFIYLTVKAPSGQTPASTNPVYIVVYEDPDNRPNAGQTFTIVIRDYQNSAGVDVAVADWGTINIIPGYDELSGSTKTPILINGGQLNSVTTIATAITTLTSGPVQYVTLFNGNVQSPLGTSDLGGAGYRRFGSSVSLTKYENTTSGSTVTAARFVVTNSHNIKIKN